MQLYSAVEDLREESMCDALARIQERFEPAELSPPSDTMPALLSGMLTIIVRAEECVTH